VRATLYPSGMLRDRSHIPVLPHLLRRTFMYKDRQRIKIMGEETTTLGTIHISPSALATIAYHATMTSYGVVGLAPRNLAEGLAMTITHEPARGVSVNYNGEEIDIDVHIIIEYGTRITSVADSVANAVRYQVEKALGMPIHHVNVHIQGLRISNPD
jgi:uncharacterized alkaline shock family protein YloU